MVQEKKLQLNRFDNRSFERGAPWWIELIWIGVQALFIASSIPGSTHRKLLLKLFGAKIGEGVVFKTKIRVKFPWRLRVDDFAWIGESVWIDNLAEVHVHSNACLSQDVYLCTGSHDWCSPTFDLIVKPVIVGEASWLGARSTVGPGVNIGEGAVLGLGSTTSKDLCSWTIYSGTPAQPVKKRIIAETSED